MSTVLMRNRTVPNWCYLLVVVIALLTIEISAQAETIYGYDGSEVFSFDSATPGRPFNVHQVTGVTNDSLRAIALRPSNNQLYAVGVNGIYTLDPMTGNATRVSTSSIQYGLNSYWGASFDASTDRLRVIWPSTSSIRDIEINVDTGQAIDDGSLAYAPGDAGAGTSLFFNGIAYGKGTAASAGTLFGLVSDNMANYDLVTIEPDKGLIRTVGGPVDTIDVGSGALLTISQGTGTAYARLQLDDVEPYLYTVDLQTGRGTLVGLMGPISSHVGLYPDVYIAAASRAEPVPEPGTTLLFSVGFALIGFTAWKQKRFGRTTRSLKVR